MGKVIGPFSNFKGSIGDLTFYQMNGQTIVRKKGSGATSTTKSAKQLLVRSQWNNIINAWKSLIGDGQQPPFANRKTGQTNYHAFMSANMNQRAVFLTDEMGKSGASVLAPYKVSQGGLAPVLVKAVDGVNQTNIALGGLTITADTTLAELSAAIIANNRGSIINQSKDCYNAEDRILYIRMEQCVDPYTGIPYFVSTQHCFDLGFGLERKVWAVLGEEGFQSRNGFLAAKSGLSNAGEVWIHLRKDRDGMIVDASAQTIVCNNPLLSQFTSRKALDEAMESFGGITKNTGMMSAANIEFMLDSFVEENAAEMGIGDGDSDGSGSVSDSGSGTADQVVISVAASPSNGGSVSGGGMVSKGATVTLRAEASSGFVFSRWSDGNTQAQRQVTAQSSTTYTAEFTATGSGGGGGYDGD